jgi:hypothetical protein
MSLSNKIIAGTLVGAGVWATAAYFRNIQRAQAQLEVIPTANIHQLSLEGLTVRIDAQLKNPTAASFKIKYPYIKLSHSGHLVGSSQSIDKDIKIPAYGQVMIHDIMVKIPVTGFFTLVFDIVKALQNKQAIIFSIEVITTVDLGWKQVAYEHKQDISLKK